MRKMRKAFSMITAIFVMIIMATVAMLVFNMSGKMVKGTTIQFRTEQAALLARSYTELAILAVTNYDRTTNNACVEDINGDVNSVIPGTTPSATDTVTSGAGYRVETRIYYIGDSLPCSASRKLNNSSNADRSATALTTNYDPGNTSPDALAAIVIDVYVFYKDPSSDNGTELSYHRRTLQKI